MPLNQSSPWHLGHQSMTLLVDMKWDRGRRKRSPCKEEERGNSWWSLHARDSGKHASCETWVLRRSSHLSCSPHSVLSVYLTSDTLPSHCFKLFPWLPNKRNWHNFLLYWNKLPNSSVSKEYYSLVHGVIWCHLGIKCNFWRDFEIVLEFLLPNSMHLLINWSPYAQEAQELFKADSS